MNERAVSSVVGIVLMIGVVVVLGGVVAGFGFGYAEYLTEPAPTTAETTGSFNYTGGITGCDTNQVEFVHEAGETVDVSEIEIVVRTLDNENVETARISGVPVPGTTFDSDNLDDPDNVVRDNCVRGAIANDDGRWSAGERIKFELNVGSNRVDPGDRVEILIVHEPSGSLITERVFLA